MNVTLAECGDDLEARFTGWSDSKRFVVDGPAVSLQLTLQHGAGLPAVSLRPYLRVLLRVWQVLQCRWQKLLACLRVVAARLRRPRRRGQ